MNDPKTLLEPLAGYLLDLIAKIRNRTFVPHSYTKLHNLYSCKSMTGATTAIEVGSFRGLTARRLSYVFDEVITIEIDPTLHEQAKTRCVKRANVDLRLGDGSKLLGEIAPTVCKALIFLDGHFSGGITGRGDEPEPVLKELDIVARHADNFVAIVIDDFRLFGVEMGWPRKSEVFGKLEELFPPPIWNVSVLNDQILVLKTAAVAIRDVRMWAIW